MIQIPNPCSKNWSEMAGDEKLKFCSSCQKHVMSLDDLSVDVINSVKFQSGTCVKISKIKLDQHSKSTHRFNYLRIFSLGFLLVNTLVFGQEDGQKIQGKYMDAYGFPIPNEIIKIKHTTVQAVTNDLGDFELILPKSMDAITLVYTISENKSSELVLDESKLDQPIEIKLKEGEDEEVILGEVIYKTSFKDRVINTITWPYRKIRSTFFDNP